MTKGQFEAKRKLMATAIAGMTFEDGDPDVELPTLDTYEVFGPMGLINIRPEERPISSIVPGKMQVRWIAEQWVSSGSYSRDEPPESECIEMFAHVSLNVVVNWAMGYVATAYVEEFEATQELATDYGAGEDIRNEIMEGKGDE